MKRIIFGILLFLNIKLDAISKQPKNIYVFGDSHAWFNHRTRFTGDIEFAAAESVSVLFKIRANPSLTMHRVGRDGLAVLNITNFGVKAGDIVIFDFGEVDCRSNIGKQRDQFKRDLNEIIDTLTTKYFNFILANQKLVSGAIYAVMSVVPPTDQQNNPEVPFYGSLPDRVKITRALNQKLKELCHQYNLIYIDIYDLYCDQNGAIRHELSDGHVHINPVANRPLKERVVKTFLDYKVL